MTLATLYLAIVLSLVDGDTLKVRIEIWPGLFTETSIRVLGIDTPEIHQPHCPKEKELGLQALSLLRTITPVGSTVMLTHIMPDKFCGRMLAEVHTPAGEVGEILIQRGVAHRYLGKGKREGWCP